MFTLIPDQNQKSELFYTENIHWYQYFKLFKVPKKDYDWFLDFVKENRIFYTISTELDQHIVIKVPTQFEKIFRTINRIEEINDFPFLWWDTELIKRKKSKDITWIKNGYKDFESLETIFRYLEKKYPSSVRISVLGKSHQQRPIYLLHITNHNSDFPYKIPIYVNSLHHGNEILSVEYVLDLVFLLLDEESVHLVNPPSQVIQKLSLEERKEFLEKLDIYLIPVVNPDGLERFWYESLHNGRKNGRNVDLNRNYPFHWHTSVVKASDVVPNSYMYRGVAPASEQEVQLIMNFLKQNPCSFGLSYHTYANKILFPYTIDTLWNPIPDRALYFGKKLLHQVVSFRKRPYTLTRKLYSVSGTDQDWIFNQTGCIAYIVEGSMNTPPFEVAKWSIVGSRRIWYNLFRIAIDEPRVEIEFFDSNYKIIKPKIQVKNFYFFENEEISNYYKNRWIFYLGNAKKLNLMLSFGKTFHKEIEIECSKICREKMNLTIRTNK
ncbi:MAG: M14 family zinc carboxypeptidase [Leptospiraceae bacterium]|nr:M14 family zinc carboxypeptidase [Leptospiraceae bacterium]MDW7975011.1 M14 family zinc carboxypeptidase [Leptospiraceae bacterium]